MVSVSVPIYVGITKFFRIPTLAKNHIVIFWYFIKYSFVTVVSGQSVDNRLDIDFGQCIYVLNIYIDKTSEKKRNICDFNKLNFIIYIYIYIYI